MTSQLVIYRGVFLLFFCTPDPKFEKNSRTLTNKFFGPNEAFLHMQ